MPTLVIFIALATILTFILALIVLMPWLRAHKSASINQLVSLNVEVFQSRIKELNTDFEKGRISAETFQAQKTELERQLLQVNKDSYADQQNKTISKENSADNNKVSRFNQSERFAKSKKARLTILFCIPILIAMGYVMAADRSAVTTLWQGQDEVGQVADDLLTGKIDIPPEWAQDKGVELLSAMQTNVHAHAHDAERWDKLSDVYLALDAKDQAIQALARAYRLDPSNENIAVKYAQTIFVANNGNLNADSYKALQGVLRNNPNHEGAQLLMAVGEARAGNYANAEAWIERLRGKISAKEGDHSAALASLDDLSANIAMQQQQSTQATQNNQAGNVGSKEDFTVVANVKIASDLMISIAQTDTLFVTVQEETGGAPLAVKRIDMTQLKQAGASSLTVKLSDADAMMPTHTISSAMADNKTLVVTARISKSGQAISESGDLTSDRMPLSYANSADNETTINVEINKKIP